LGENFLRKQAKQFEHGSDLAFRAFVEPDLLSRLAPLQSRLFTCAARDANNLPSPGQPVIVMHTPTSLMIVQANVAVGEVRSTEAAPLIALLKMDLACAGMVNAIVSDRVELTGEFMIRVAEAEADQ
jgi:hypothetical protein